MDKTRNAVNIFDKYASQYQGKFMDVSLYADSFNFFCHSIKKRNPEILELACGPGNISKYVLKQRPDFNLLGTDLAPNMIALAKENNPTGKFQVMDARDLGQLDKKYDGIICGFCLPYLSKEETLSLIKDASKILHPEGYIYLSTMEDDYSQSGFKKGSQGDEIYMHYYLAEDLEKMLKETGFLTLQLERKESVQTDGTTAIDLIIIAKKIN